MTEQKNQLASLFAACWKDEALKARFMADPKAVLAEYDMPVFDGMDVKVVENADNCVHITMPAPPSDHEDLSDETLRNAAGGVGNPSGQNRNGIVGGGAYGSGGGAVPGPLGGGTGNPLP
jgi:hypothetical protein